MKLHDTVLLAKLAAGDMIAIDAKYHPKCLVSLYNRVRKLEMSSAESTIEISAHGIAFAELIDIYSYIEECRCD